MYQPSRQPNQLKRTRPARRLRMPDCLRPTVLVLFVITAFAGGVGVDRLALDGTHDATAATIFTELPEFAILEETYNAIRENYVQSDDISDKDLIYGASQGMVEALGDEGHSTFLSPEEAERNEASLRGELIGIGVYVDRTGPMPVVIAPIDNSPAYDAGIKSGDVIVAIDGTLTADMDEDEWTERIRGDAGTEVKLSILHQGDEEPYEVTITREKIRVQPVSWRMLPGDIAWIKLSEFSQGATDGLVVALSQAKAGGAKGVILDLRNNPGGFVFEAQNVGSQFLKDGSILFREQDREGKVTPVKTPGNSGEWLDGPVVVLVNEGSASAAEIVSSALRDNERATLIGETTFGTGTVLLPFELSDGSVVQLGTELWLTADGDQIWKKGVVPDKEVTLDEGSYPALPIDFTRPELTDNEFAALQDGQLAAGYESMQQTLRQGHS